MLRTSENGEAVRQDLQGQWQILGLSLFVVIIANVFAIHQGHNQLLVGGACLAVRHKHFFNQFDFMLSLATIFALT